MDADAPAAGHPDCHIEPWLLEKLRCPLTKQRLELMTRAEVEAHGLNATAALIREDRAVCYPMENGLPVLLPERAISLARPSI